MVESVTLSSIDAVTGEVKRSVTLGRQEALPAFEFDVTRSYLVQVTVVSECTVDAKDEQAAAEMGASRLAAGEGETIKRTVSAKLVR